MSLKTITMAALAASAAMIASVGSAYAATYTCKCDAAFAADTMSKVQTDDFHASCAETWAAGKPANETDTGGYSSLIKATFVEGVPPDNVTAIRARPRKPDQCIMALYDGYNKKEEWRGLNCDTSQNTSRDGFNVVDLPKPTAGLKQISGSVQLTSKTNNFVAFYIDNAVKGGKGYTLQAACVEPK